MWGIGCCPGKKIQSPLSSDMQDHPSKRCSFYLALRRRKKATTKCWSLSLLHEKKNWIREIWRGDFPPSLFHTPAMLERGWGGVGHNKFFLFLPPCSCLIISNRNLWKSDKGNGRNVCPWGHTRKKGSLICQKKFIRSNFLTAFSLQTRWSNLINTDHFLVAIRRPVGFHLTPSLALLLLLHHKAGIPCPNAQKFINNSFSFPPSLLIAEGR